MGLPQLPRDPKHFIEFRDLPNIFRPTNSFAALPAAATSEKITEQERKLLQARTFIEVTPERSNEGVRIIEQLLAQRTPDTTWPASAYAALAAKATFNQGDLARTKELVQEGLKARPDNRELQYVARLVEHEEAARVQKLSAAK
jgi:hypothetical protein